MLTAEMPLWFKFFFLSLTFAIKHVANERIEQLDCIQRTFRVHGLTGLLLIVPTINSIVTLGILYPFIGYWALGPAILDWFLTVVLVTYRVKQLPREIVPHGLFNEFNLMRLVTTIAYLNYVLLGAGIVRLCTLAA